MCCTFLSLQVRQQELHVVLGFDSISLQFWMIFHTVLQFVVDPNATSLGVIPQKEMSVSKTAIES